MGAALMSCDEQFAHTDSEWEERNEIPWESRCPRCHGFKGWSARNHDDPKWLPCSTCGESGRVPPLSLPPPNAGGESWFGLARIRYNTDLVRALNDLVKWVEVRARNIAMGREDHGKVAISDSFYRLCHALDGQDGLRASDGLDWRSFIESECTRVANVDAGMIEQAMFEQNAIMRLINRYQEFIEIEAAMKNAERDAREVGVAEVTIKNLRQHMEEARV
jgi:hypothetical protein